VARHRRRARQTFDLSLVDAVKRGVVVVDEVTEAASRAMLRAEILELHPSERPTLGV
jgi:hypothetical protein